LLFDNLDEYYTLLIEEVFSLFLKKASGATMTPDALLLINFREVQPFG
jgi:hypothetical protein